MATTGAERVSLTCAELPLCSSLACQPGLCNEANECQVGHVDRFPGFRLHGFAVLHRKGACPACKTTPYVARSGTQRRANVCTWICTAAARAQCLEGRFEWGGKCVVCNGTQWGLLVLCWIGIIVFVTLFHIVSQVNLPGMALGAP